MADDEIRYATPSGQVNSGLGAVARWLIVAGIVVAGLIIVPWVWTGNVYQKEAALFLDTQGVTVPEAATVVAIRDDELSDYFFIAEGVTATIDGVPFLVGFSDGESAVERPEGADVEPIALGAATGIAAHDVMWATVSVGEQTWVIAYAGDLTPDARAQAAWDRLVEGLEFADQDADAEADQAA